MWSHIELSNGEATNKARDKFEVAKENNENYLTDEEQHKIIIKDYDMLFEYRE